MIVQSMIIEVRSVQTTVDKSSQTEELQRTTEKHEIHLEELQMQREKIRGLEIKIQEMQQLEKTSLAPKNSCEKHFFTIG